MSETAGRVFEDYVVGSVLRHPLGRTIIDADTPDGFYRSGDLMRRHPSGSYAVEGRKKDVINRGGDKISAEEIQVQKLPERLEIMAEFPLSPIGKVSKKDLMAMVAKQVEAGS